MASSELTSLPRLCDIVWPQLYIFGYVKWLLFTRKVLTNELFLMLLQNQPNYKGENMHIQKVILSSDLLLSPPHPSYYTPRVIGLRGNDNTTM